MKHLAYMEWLGKQAAGGLTYLWPVTLVLSVLVGAALFWDFSYTRLKFGRRSLFLLLPSMGIVFTLLVGTLFERQPSLVYLAYVGFGAGVLLAVVAAFVLRPAWRSSISISLTLLWYSLWCWFVSVMSITGDWL
jgi:hypothetical protein